MGRTKKIILTGAMLITAGGTIPVSTEDMQLLYSYKDDCVYVDDRIATSTPFEDPRPYIPDCRQGEYSVSVFENRKGDKIYVEIPTEQYQ
jgi:hypothetical protein